MEDMVVIKDTCIECPEDTAGVPWKGRCKCMCTHEPSEPHRKDKNCPRNTIKETPHLNATSTPNVVWPGGPLHGNRTNETETIGSNLEVAFNYDYASFLLMFGITSFIICIIVTICLVKRRTFNRTHRFNSQNLLEMKCILTRPEQLLPDKLINNPTYETTCMDLSIRIFSNDDITLVAQIGQGCFGKVFKGELNGDTVAVKIVRSGHAGEAQQEIETMASFSHPNILSLIGIAKNPVAESPWLLFEFMEHGDLASVLRKHSPQGYVRENFPRIPDSLSTTDDDETTSLVKWSSEPLHLEHEALCNIAAQIAEGMKYLSLQHFVHRDLAARNCLISKTGVVKISDFGLSRDVYTCDYYKIGGSKLLPIRWMAPESILYGCFTLESDVWAFGVVLWEIYTWGKQPYFGHSNEEVVHLILDGILLCPPSDCPTIIKDIMQLCWKTRSNDRLTFHQICEKFAQPNRLPVFCDFSGGQMETQFSQVPRTDADHMQSQYEIPRKIGNEIEYFQVV